MIPRESRDVVVLGGGPAGLAAALAAASEGAGTLLLERDGRLGGVLNQCVHDGFGLERFGERLTGPEYALRDARRVAGSGVEARLETFVHEAVRLPEGEGFRLTCVDRARGLHEVETRALVLATGCRERTDRQVLIHGDRPAGIFTAGLAQRLVNVEGLLPGRRAVILGSGDIGLIMARRLVLEGVEVEGVYELKQEPSGLGRNLRQCLEDFGIPLHLGTTVTEVVGARRVEAVVTMRVDGRGAPLAGSERLVPCDSLILSVGLIPENEIALSLGLSLDPATRGPRMDQAGASELPGVFLCGNAVHVNDLADYVSESGSAAGASAARYAKEFPRRVDAGMAAPSAAAQSAAAAAAPARPAGPAGAARLPLKAGPGFLYAVPQCLDPAGPPEAAVYFRANATLREGGRVALRALDAAGAPIGEPLVARRFPVLRPPEMERLSLSLGDLPAGAVSLALELEPARVREEVPRA